jgi:hypothetical protein
MRRKIGIIGASPLFIALAAQIGLKKSIQIISPLNLEGKLYTH